MLMLLLAATIALVQTPKPAPAPNLVRIFVQTDDSGEPTELAARQQSVKDLASALASKKKTLTVVEDEAMADVTVEVLSRGLVVPKMVIGLSPRPGEPAGMVAPTRTVVLRVRLTLAEEPVEFTNKNKPQEFQDGWKRAADDIGNQVEKWIAGRLAEILRRRGGSQSPR